VSAALHATTNMNPTHAGYMRRETLIAALINAGFSALAVFLVFGRRDPIEFWGAQGLALDFVPQTFIITLMTVTVATLLTRRRVRQGVIPALPRLQIRFPSNVLLRAMLLGAVATVLLGGAATILLAAFRPSAFEFADVLVLKIAYGIIVAAVTAIPALRAALGD